MNFRLFCLFILTLKGNQLSMNFNRLRWNAKLCLCEFMITWTFLYTEMPKKKTSLKQTSLSLEPNGNASPNSATSVSQLREANHSKTIVACAASSFSWNSHRSIVKKLKREFFTAIVVGDEIIDEIPKYD